MSASELTAVMESRAIASIRAQKDIWAKNAAANRVRVRQDGDAGQLWLGDNYKTGVLIAAGPSLEASIPELWAMDRKTHELIAVDMALAALLEARIIPDFVICSDASDAIAQTLRVEDEQMRARLSRTTLLLNLVVHPDTGKDWPGPVLWYGMMSNVFDKDAGDWMQHMHAQMGGVKTFLVPGGNVGSLGLSFLLGVRASPKVLLYGHDFCWTDDSRFYSSGKFADLAAERIRSEKASGTVVAMKDKSGNAVWTNASLMYFRDWFADQMRRFPGAVENRSPSTIL